MESCPRCRKKPAYRNASYCGPCICEVIENRVKKAIAASVRSGTVKIACADRDSLACVSAAFICKKLLGKQFVKIFPRRGNALAESADDIATGFLESLIGKRNQPPRTSLLGSVTEKELGAYATIKNLKYKTSKACTGSIKQRLQRLQEKRPGTIESVTRSWEALQAIER